jgi:hypothetical protein
MSEQIKSPIISRRKVFWLAAIAAALAAPATMLPSDARAQQSDQAPAAEPTAPKTGEKKKKEKKKKEKNKKSTPGAATAPASSQPKMAPAQPKQQ